jgi:hypothetical protein
MRTRGWLVALMLALTVGWAASAAAAPKTPFYFGLRRLEAEAQAAFFAVQQPHSRNDRRFLTAAQLPPAS